MAIFGNTASPTGETSQTGGRYDGNKASSGGSGVGQKITASLRTTGGSVKATCALFSSDGTFLSSSGEMTITNTTLQLIDFPFTSTINNQDYLIIIQANSTELRIGNRQDNSGPQYLSDNHTYPTWTNTSFLSGFTDLYTLYVTYSTTLPTWQINCSEVISVIDNRIVTVVNPNTRNVLVGVPGQQSESITIGESSPRLVRNPDPPSVIFAYIIPSDKSYNDTYYQNLLVAHAEIRNFYGNQLNNGFTFASPIHPVQILSSGHPSSFFFSNNSSNDLITATNEYFTLAPSAYPLDAHPLFGADSSKVIIFIDFGLTETSAAGVANLNGVTATVFPPGLIDISNFNGYYIDATAHELGHTYNLSHVSDGSMMTAGGVYGLGFINPTQLVTLRNSGIFQDVFLGPRNISINDSSSVSEFTTVIAVSGTGLKVFAQEIVTASDTIITKAYSIYITESLRASDVDLDGFAGDVVLIISSISVSDSTLVTDYLPPNSELIFMRDDVSIAMPPQPTINLDTILTRVRGLRLIDP